MKAPSERAPRGKYAGGVLESMENRKDAKCITVISGSGTLLADDSKGHTKTYHIRSDQGFLIAPNQVTTYVSSQELPWDYVWLEFDGLRVKEALELSGLSADAPSKMSMGSHRAHGGTRMRGNRCRMIELRQGGFFDVCLSGYGKGRYEQILYG